jgi:hypothetical protein
LGASGHLRGRTGLSACIFFACGKKGYRFNPLREPKPLCGFGYAKRRFFPQNPRLFFVMLNHLTLA